jgi:hypothetical protein
MKPIEEQNLIGHNVDPLVDYALSQLFNEVCLEFDISGDISPQLNERWDDCYIEVRNTLIQFVIDNLKKH